MEDTKTTREKILEYIKAKNQASPADLVSYLNISRQALFKQLGKLMHSGEIRKIGRSPSVFYAIQDTKASTQQNNINDATKKTIEETYMIVTPSGEMKVGLDGFTYWCDRNKLPVEKTAAEYIKTVSKYDAWKKDGLINATEKITSSFKEVGLDRLYYIDFYSIERFGKTKLGQLLLYAKQSQDKAMMNQIAVITNPVIETITKKFKINGVGFIPPTVKREVQLMKELRRILNIPIKEISIIKARTEISVPQKTLSRIEDRIENAKSSIFVDDTGTYDNILLIDDAVGSGSTLNETALQIKKRKMCSGKIIGLAITGSFKGFDVISEV